MASSPRSSWLCAQIGAREHYAIPRALHQAGKLAGLYTDFWAGPVLRKLLPARGPLGSLKTRFHPDLVDAPVQAFRLRSLAWEARLRSQARKEGGPYGGFCEVGRRFALAVAERLSRHDLPPDALFFAYDTGALEAFAALRPRGVRCVLNQMDPNRVEVELVREEEKRWPGWALRTTDVPETYFRRREQEWALADSVIVNSEFSRQALIRQGLSSEKIVVIPLCYEADAGAAVREVRADVSTGRPLRILFLGQVILRKGIQYLIEAARLLQNEPVHFDVVGSIGISAEAVRSAPANVTFHGPVGRGQTEAWYRQSDLFVLPTLSDGFALTQLEAMAYGLPVIATANCGDVVTNGVDGALIPTHDAQALAAAITGYVSDRNRLHTHQIQARQKATQFSIARLQQNLAALQGRGPLSPASSFGN